jgi:hypothetical protein
MKVTNMLSSKGNRVANQFIVEDVTIKSTGPSGTDHFFTGHMFQSYNSNIAFEINTGGILLDERFWDYSVTTGKYRNQFLGEGIAETRKKIASGEYTLINLN